MKTVKVGPPVKAARTIAARLPRLGLRSRRAGDLATERPLRLALVISSLGTGGAQRVLVALADRWAAGGHDVVLVTLDARYGDRFSVASGVRRFRLDVVRESPSFRAAVAANLRAVARLRACLRGERPDVVVSFLDVPNVVTLLACTWLDVPVVVCEQVAPEQHEAALSRPWRALRRLTYRRAARLVVVSRDMISWATRITGADRVAVIPNLVAFDRRAEGARAQTVVALGRLVQQKGFDVLLEAFSFVSPRFPAWRLVVWGEGPERGALEERIAALGLDRAVRLPGETSAADEELAAAGVFVLSSRFEGFPVALVEAMALGAPVIATDCPHGPREIVRHEVDGLLVPPDNPTALAAALERLLADEALRRTLARNAAGIVDRFGVEPVGRRWDALVVDVLAERYHGRGARHAPESER